MKRLFSGVAFAALIAAPVWAQAPTNAPAPNAPSASPPATAQAPAAAQTAPTASEKSATAPTKKETATAAAPRQHRAMRHARHMPRHTAHMRYAQRMHPMWRSHYGMSRHYAWYRPHRMYRSYYGWGRVHGPTDFMARQLNRQQLGEIYSGGGMAPGPRPYSPSGY